MGSVSEFWKDYPLEMLLGMAGMQLLLFLLWLVVLIRSVKQKKAIRSLEGKLAEGERLVELLDSDQFEGTDLFSYLRYLDEKNKFLKGNIGLIRYNAIGERASDMSFSLAMLDTDKNGVVISSLFSNQGQSYIYAKPLVNGKSTYRLSKEEEQAIQQAFTTPLEPEGPSIDPNFEVKEAVEGKLKDMKKA